MAVPSSEMGGRQLRPGKSNRILLVRHLPAVLTASEKEELLRHFGASSVRILSDYGRLVGKRHLGACRVVYILKALSSFQ